MPISYISIVCSILNTDKKTLLPEKTFRSIMTGTASITVFEEQCSTLFTSVSYNSLLALLLELNLSMDDLTRIYNQLPEKASIQERFILLTKMHALLQLFEKQQSPEQDPLDDWPKI